MSNITLQNTNLRFGVSIVAIDRERNGVSLPLDIGAITHLEIKDDLINFGITGSITYVNWFQILDRLGISTRGGKTLYIVIEIGDEDNKDKIKDISFIGLLESSASNGGNILDLKQTYKFEEDITARLKKTSLTNLNSFKSSGSIPELIQSLLEQSKTPYDPAGFNEASSQSVGTTSIRNYWKENDSLYQTITNLYNSFMYRGLTGSVSDPPLLTVENTLNGDTVERKVKLNKLLTINHLKFLEAYINNRGGDFKDVYQEEFLIGPEERESAHTSLYNKVEHYDHLKPDLGDLRETIWGKYREDVWGSNSEPLSLDSMRVDFVDFNTYIQGFEELIKLPSNVPPLKLENQKLFSIPGVASGENDPLLIKCAVYNRVLRSFVFCNEAIVLKNIKGRIYRNPGMFITIRGGLNDRKAPQTDIWFVISVKHLFIDGNYENEIVAVRFLGNQAFNTVSTAQTLAGGYNNLQNISNPLYPLENVSSVDNNQPTIGGNNVPTPRVPDAVFDTNPLNWTRPQ